MLHSNNEQKNTECVFCRHSPCQQVAVVNVSYSHLMIKILTIKLVCASLQRDFMFAAIGNLVALHFPHCVTLRPLLLYLQPAGYFNSPLSDSRYLWWSPVGHARTPVQR